MSLVDDVPGALQRLRKRSGLKQEDLRERGGPPKSTVAKLESRTRPPDFATVASFLSAIGADLFDLAAAVEEGRPGARLAGAARAEWVAALVRRGINPDVLTGIAVSFVDSPEAAADLVASAEAAARDLAMAAIEEARAAASRLEMVAEPTPDYGRKRR